jgi:hypothetical protein
MYGRFLHEAAALTGRAGLLEAGDELQAAGDCWEKVAALFDRASKDPDPNKALVEICALLAEIANQEQTVWSRLKQLAVQAAGAGQAGCG